MEFTTSSIPTTGDPPAERSSARVLIVDDEPALRRDLASVLTGSGFDVLTAEDGPAALSLLAGTSVDVVLADLEMSPMNGLELLGRLRDKHRGVELVMMAGESAISAAMSAVQAGAYDFLTKPLDLPELVPLVVAKAAERKRLVSHARELEQRLEQREEFGELVGSSPRMREVYRMALGVASTASTVLILGETGTGKELIARAIHQHSARSSGPFVTLSCGAIPPELIERELFGQAMGDEGPRSQRPCLFESAHHGTLLLDEVGELPVPAQARLLQALQDGELKGAGAAKPVDVRVIATTKTDLKVLVAAGKLREDLYYRLNAIVIRMPALRQRREDIPLLAYHFLQHYARRAGRDVKRISVEAMRMMREQRWPGNVRELETTIERAVVLCRADTIFPGDLPFSMLDSGEDAPESEHLDDGASPFIALRSGWEDLPYADAKERVLDAFHRTYLGVLLRRTGGNVSEAARQAGLDRSNFRRVLKRYGPALERHGEASPEGES